LFSLLSPSYDLLSIIDIYFHLIGYSSLEFFKGKQCTTVRSLGPIQQKSTKKMRRKIHISMVTNEMEGHINRLPTRGRARSIRT
jgi:hypothetical protein